ASIAKSASYPKLLPGKGSAMLHAPASNGCLRPRKHAQKWDAPIQSSHPKSHNHCDEVLATSATPRATASAELPGPTATMMVMVRAGQAWASALFRPTTRLVNRPAPPTRMSLRFNGLTPCALQWVVCVLLS